MHSQSLVGKDPRVICILDSHFHRQFVDYFDNSRRNLLILIWFCSLDKTDRNYGDDLGWFGVKRSPRLSAPNYCFLPFACTILVICVCIIHLAEYYMRVLLWAIKAMGRKGCCYWHLFSRWHRDFLFLHNSLMFHFFAFKLQKNMARAHFQLFVMNTSTFLQHLTSISSTMSR